LLRARGFSFSSSLAARRKKRGWTIQHRPTSNPSKALPDSPGRAGQETCRNEASVLAGLKCFCFRTIHGGSGSEKQDSRACISFGDPQNKISAKLGRQKNIDWRRIRYKLIVIYLD
jgi:hypothetical protein